MQKFIGFSGSIESNQIKSYDGLRDRLNKIMALDYFTSTPELKKLLKRGYKSLLLILDDVPNGQTQELEEIRFTFEGSKSVASDEEVGQLMQNAGEIAFQKLSGSAVRFKVLLTSTTQQALIDMKTESMHNLQVLPDQEAIQWFQKMVGGRAKDRAYQNTVNGMVKNCA